MSAGEEAPGAPQKVCPHCGAMNNTLSKRCPTCNKKYKKRTVLKVLAILTGLFVLFIVAIVVLIGAGASSVSNQLDKEQNAHAISATTYKSIQLGDRKSAVLDAAGKAPENAQEFQTAGVLDSKDIKSSCVYWNKKGGSFGDIYQFCFDNGRLTSKNSY